MNVATPAAARTFTAHREGRRCALCDAARDREATVAATAAHALRDEAVRATSQCLYLRAAAFDSDVLRAAAACAVAADRRADAAVRAANRDRSGHREAAAATAAAQALREDAAKESLPPV